MPENTRRESARPDPAPVPAKAEDFYEDADYTAPVKKDDAGMIEFLSTRAKKPLR